MKNIFIAAIFLFSQMGFSAEKMNRINAKGYHIENEKLSSLILTKEELIHLSDGDKTKYLISMIALSQILEGSQRDVMGYEAENERAPQKTSFIHLQKLNQILASVSPASAWIIPLLIDGAVILGASGAMQGLKAAGRYVAARVAGRTVAEMGKVAAEKAAVRMSQQAVMAAEATTAARALAAGTPEAMAAAKEAVILNLRNFKSATQAVEVAVKEKKGAAEISRLAEAARAAELSAKKANQVFLSKAKDPKLAEKELETMTKDSKVWGYVKNNWKKFLGGALIFKGADAYFKEENLTSISPSRMLIESAATEAAAQLTPEIKAGDSSKADKKSCVYGGHPSVWKDFGEEAGGILCTRPEASKSEICKGEKNFLCNSYGISFEDSSLASKLCLNPDPKKELTVRCSKELIETIGQKKASVSSEKLDTFLKHLKEIATGIESKPDMKDEEGKTKSIFAYCGADNVSQTDECKAIMDVLAALKDTKAPTILASRKETPSAAPSAPASSAPAAGEGDTKN